MSERDSVEILTLLEGEVEGLTDLARVCMGHDQDDEFAVGLSLCIFVPDSDDRRVREWHMQLVQACRDRGWEYQANVDKPASGGWYFPPKRETLPYRIVVYVPADAEDYLEFGR